MPPRKARAREVKSAAPSPSPAASSQASSSTRSRKANPKPSASSSSEIAVPEEHAEEGEESEDPGIGVEEEAQVLEEELQEAVAEGEDVPGGEEVVGAGGSGNGLEEEGQGDEGDAEQNGHREAEGAIPSNGHGSGSVSDGREEVKVSIADRLAKLKDLRIRMVGLALISSSVVHSSYRLPLPESIQVPWRYEVVLLTRSRTNLPPKIDVTS